MRYRITTPVAGFSGTSVDVPFQDGQAVVDVPSDDPQDKQARRVAYFRSAGYGVEEIGEDGEPVTDEAPAKRRTRRATTPAETPDDDTKTEDPT